MRTKTMQCQCFYGTMRPIKDDGTYIWWGCDNPGCEAGNYVPPTRDEELNEVSELKMWYTINKIRKLQTGDINHMCDSIYFQGCDVGCPYCFNKETWNADNGAKLRIDEIISKLSKIKWVCLLGGEPMEQGHTAITQLIDELHKIDKKVVLFTSYVDAPNLVKNADHYHIDVKVWDKVVAVPFDKTSYGAVAIMYPKEDYEFCFQNITDKPIYIKSPVGAGGYTDVILKVRRYLHEIGCEQTYLNMKIMVDDYDIL